MVELEIPISEELKIMAHRKARVVRAMSSWQGVCWMFLKTLLMLVLLVAVIGCLAIRLWVVVPFFVAFEVILLLSPRIDEWLIRRNFRKTVWVGGPSVHVTLSGEGVRFDDGKNGSWHDWAVFVAWRFNDGILLGSRKASRWLPFNRIVSGNEEELVRLVRDKAKLGRWIMRLTNRTHSRTLLP